MTHQNRQDAKEEQPLHARTYLEQVGKDLHELAFFFDDLENSDEARKSYKLVEPSKTCKSGHLIEVLRGIEEDVEGHNCHGVD